MAFFVVLSLEQRRRLFKRIKIKAGPWNNFYPKYNLSKSMFFNYLSGRYNLPLSLFNSWKKLAEFQEEVRIIEKTIYLKKEIKEVILDENLSEVLGVLNGDGHISKTKKEICVVGNKHEQNYALYLKSLFSKKLHIEFHLFFYSNSFKLKGYSTKLSELLMRDYGLPNGNKLGKLHIPSKILLNKQFLIRYIKGLFDTDGTFYRRRKNDVVIEISNADKKYLIEVKSALENLGFTVSLLKNHLAIYKKEEIKNFFNLIKPANNKHLKKFENYSKL